MAQAGVSSGDIPLFIEAGLTTREIEAYLRLLAGHLRYSPHKIPAKTGF